MRQISYQKLGNLYCLTDVQNQSDSVISSFYSNIYLHFIQILYNIYSIPIRSKYNILWMTGSVLVVGELYSRRLQRCLCLRFLYIATSVGVVQ